MKKIIYIFLGLVLFTCGFMRWNHLKTTPHVEIVSQADMRNRLPSSAISTEQSSEPKGNLSESSQPLGIRKLTAAELNTAISHQESEPQLDTAEFEKLFSPSPEGRKLAQMVALYPFHGMNTREGTRLNQLIEDFQFNPEPAFNEISRSFAKVPKGLSSEREFLVQMVGKLAVEPEKKVTFFKTELSNSVSASDSSLTIVTFKALIEDSRIAKDAADAIRSLSKTDPLQGAIRQILLTQMEMKFPSETEQLRSELQ